MQHLQTCAHRALLQPLRSSPLVQGRCRRSVTCSAFSGFKARWSLDVKFGSKQDAVALLQEWVATVGNAAGLTPANTTLTTGSIGVPESTLELEVSFSSLAELEAFWSAIPQQQHKAWGQRMQQYIVHGSPQWQVYRCLPAFADGAGAAAEGPGARRGSAAMSSSTSTSNAGTSLGSLLMPSDDEISKFANADAAVLSTPQQQTDSGLSVVSGEEEAQVVLDWKGEPMQINPGDKLPFKFM